ncbi:MAG: hypothetical protein A4E53_01644 [Pelotomaculum sp. PtaB.Bin104]|jgi:hypothetical protein|nr:MAG: hypothetical protein A4E53_01644 [Pelotomaculum sp. PtaB.Bin104]
MKIGYLICTPQGLEKLAKAIRTLNGKSARLEVHQDEDTHGVIRLCCSPEAGWIDLEKGFYDSRPAG